MTLQDLCKYGPADFINRVFDDGFTPLTTAVRHRQVYMAKFLLDNGADANLPSWSGSTPLWWAVKRNDGCMCLVLLKAGAKCYLPDSGECIPPQPAFNADDPAQLLNWLRLVHTVPESTDSVPLLLH